MSISRTKRRSSTKKVASQKYFDHVVTGDEVGEHGTHLEGYAERTDALPLRTTQQRIPRHKHASGARRTRRSRKVPCLSKGGVLLARVKKQSRSSDTFHVAGTKSWYPARHDVQTSHDMIRGGGPPHPASLPENDGLRIALSRDT